MFVKLKYVILLKQILYFSLYLLLKTRLIQLSSFYVLEYGTASRKVL